ncbi:MAG: vWA domain-containing protein [Bryobacteraceae bacterium]|jgi:Flp pilus assembly protein TadG
MPTHQKIRTGRERGMAVMITAIALTFLVPMVGLAIDGGVAFIVKSRLGSALDSAALAAGRGVISGSTQSAAAASGTTTADDFFTANFPVGYLNTSPASQTACGSSGESNCSNVPTGDYESCSTNVCATFAPNSAGYLAITVTATVNSPTYFMRWIGVNSVAVSGTGQTTRPNLAIVLLLDKSSSMGTRDSAVGTMPASINYSTASSCEAMIYNSYQFTQNFSPFDTVAEVSFNGTVSLDYPPSSNFKASGASGVENAIANIQCGSNTNTTGALAMAASVLNYINQPQAVNHIVIFTDGVANAVNSSSFALRTSALVPSSNNDYRMGPGPANNTNLSSSTTPTAAHNTTNCANGTPTLCDMGTCVTSGTTIQGAMTQAAGFSTSGGTMYLLQAFSTNYPYTGTTGSGDASPSVPAGCTGTYADYTTAGAVQATIAYIPTTDRFGNSTSGLWNNIVEQVNSNTAPSGTPITPGNSATKNLTGLWSSYASVGTNTAIPSGGTPSNYFPSSGSYNPSSFQGQFRPDLPNTIGIVSMNTAYNQAKAIQSNASAGTNPSGYSNPTAKYSVTIDAIYLQGNGGDPVDPYFLQYLSNQANLQVPSCIYTASSYPYTPTYTSNPNYVSTQPSGTYVSVSSTSQLSAAFSQIAASLLRVTE